MPAPLLLLLAVLIAVPLLVVVAGMSSQHVARDLARQSALCALMRAHGVRDDLEALADAWVDVPVPAARRIALIAAGVEPLQALSACNASLSGADLARIASQGPDREAKFSSARRRALAMPRSPQAG